MLPLNRTMHFPSVSRVPPFVTVAISGSTDSAGSQLNFSRLTVYDVSCSFQSHHIYTQIEHPGTHRSLNEECSSQRSPRTPRTAAPQLQSSARQSMLEYIQQRLLASSDYLASPLNQRSTWHDVSLPRSPSCAGPGKCVPISRQANAGDSPLAFQQPPDCCSCCLIFQLRYMRSNQCRK